MARSASVVRSSADLGIALARRQRLPVFLGVAVRRVAHVEVVECLVASFAWNELFDHSAFASLARAGENYGPHHA